MNKKTEVLSESQDYRWNLKDLFESDKAWEEEFDRVRESVAALKEYKGRIGESAETFFAFLKAMHDAELAVERISLYAFLSHSEDTKVAKYLEYSARAEWLKGQFAENTAFFLPEYRGLSFEQVADFLAKMPEYSFYKRYLEELERLRPHILSVEEETLLAQSAEVLGSAYNTYNLFVNADLVFPTVSGEEGKIRLTEANYGALIRSPRRKVRKDAFFGLFDTYGKFKNTLSQTLSGSAKGDLFYARAKKFSSTLEASLFDDNLTVQFYDTILSKIHEWLPENHRYIELKKKCLGYRKFYPYDLYAPLVEEKEQNISYDEAKKIVIEGLSPLGKEYGQILREGLNNGWVDVFPKEGKVSGAFCASVWGTHPYVLLNFNGTFHETLTLGHEMGHALHSYFSNKAQPYIYAEHSIIAAEVASITNELLILRYLLGKAQKREQRLSLLNNFLENFRTTVFRQAMFAEFEREIHGYVAEGNTLTADWLCELWQNLNYKYYGSALEDEPALRMEWARIPHFYASFYVYKYVLGFVSAVAISDAIYQGKEGAVEKYLEFLHSGNTAEPLILLERLGVNLRNGEAIDTAVETFRVYLDLFIKEFYG